MNAPPTRVLKYDALADAYQRALVDVLRGHSAGEDFLELWVPDEDPVKSILNMIEAAQAAGRGAVAIEVSASTIGRDQAQRLETLAARHGTVAVMPISAGYLVDVRGLQDNRRAAHVVSDAGNANNNRASAVGPLADREHAVGGHSDPGRYDILPALAASLEAESDTSHEGMLTPRAPLIVAEGSSPLGTISALIDPQTHVIVSARHCGITPGAGSGVANLVCRHIEGRTVQEASDHGGIIAIHRLYAAAGRPKVNGILLPNNAGRVFVEIVDLLHRLRANFAAQTGMSSTTNVFDLPVGERWQRLSADARLSAAEAALRQFCERQGLASGAVHIDRIDKDLPGNPARVVVTIDGSVGAAAKPVLLRALERHLKTAIDDKIQIYLEPLKDNNKLRRL